MSEVTGVSAIVLAAGRSARMGEANKLLADIDGTAAVRLAVSAALDSRVTDVIVVIGHEADKVRQALDGLDVCLVHNPDYPEGLSTSLKAGIAVVPEARAGAIVLLGDMPKVNAAVVDRLIERFEADDGRAICRPTCEGRPGNPVLWPQALFAEIMALGGDVGARGLIDRHPERLASVEVGDPGIHFDIDTPADLDPD